MAASVVLTLGGIARFLAGHAFFKWAVFGVLPWSRAVAIAALAGLRPLGFALPTLALSSAAVVIVVALAAWDALAYQRHVSSLQRSTR